MCIWHRVSSEDEDKEALCWHEKNNGSLFIPHQSMNTPPTTTTMNFFFLLLIFVTNNMMPDAQLLCL